VIAGNLKDTATGTVRMIFIFKSDFPGQVIDQQVSVIYFGLLETTPIKASNYGYFKKYFFEILFNFDYSIFALEIADMNTKNTLLNKCKEIVNTKISIAEKAMIDAQNSANNEDKSTAGDKFDTARAMSHIERDMYAKQLAEAAKQKIHLDSIKIKYTAPEVTLGSLVFTEMGIYFISVGLGKVVVDKEDYIAISPTAPIGQKLIDKKSGDTFIFQGKSTQILNIL